jgi:hypothetical protein
MKKPAEGENWYFVDETGDPVFYDRRGNLIVGQEGCSPILGLSFIETTEPGAIRNALTELHVQVATDKYLQAIPSIRKTNRAFHAKDDSPEIRYLVFQRIAQLDFKAQVVVARKAEKVFRNAFHARESEFYDHLISQLFKNVLHLFSHNHIYFAQRGSRLRQAQFEQAIRRGGISFQRRYATKAETIYRVDPQTPIGEPCLQVVDYLNWAVYRAFTKGEMRYSNFIEDKVNLLVDLYDTEKYPKNWYNRDNPFSIEKASPL